MMGVYIDMEMPKSCRKCMISQPDGCGWICPIIESKPIVDGRVNSRHPHCPLVPVPEPHGRLIDADEFDERIRQAGGMCEEELTEDFKDGVQTVLAMLKTQTTIIPAEEGET